LIARGDLWFTLIPPARRREIMRRLFISASLGDLFIGGLLAVARADGVVKPEEMDSLRSASADLGLLLPDEEDLLFAEDVTADRLAEAVKGSAEVYRGGGSTPDEIGRAFLEAALRLAIADGELVIEEVVMLRALAAALGLSTEEIAGWHLVDRFEA
jgi:tellurite resistance protein